MMGWPYFYGLGYGNGYGYGYGWPYYAPETTGAPPAYNEPEEQQQSSYWYYCQNPQGYYPYIRSCPGGWLTVVPNATPPNQQVPGVVAPSPQAVPPPAPSMGFTPPPSGVNPQPAVRRA